MFCNSGFAIDNWRIEQVVDNKETLNFICEKILKSQLPKSKF